MRKREFWLLVGPSMLVMFGLLVVPLYRTIQWSFQEVQYGAAGVFVGLQNYTAALTDPRFGRAVLFTVVLTLVVTAFLVVLGYIIATLVNQIGKLRPVVLGILLVSYVLPAVVGSAAFSWLFDTNFGGVANLLFTRLTGAEILWFTDVWPNRVMIILFTIWHLLPFSMLIILAGLQGVPDEIIEAAEIDGATSLKSHLLRHRADHPRSAVLRHPDLDHGRAAHLRPADPARAAGRRDRQRVDHVVHLQHRLPRRQRAARSGQRGQRADHPADPADADSLHPRHVQGSEGAR